MASPGPSPDALSREQMADVLEGVLGLLTTQTERSPAALAGVMVVLASLRGDPAAPARPTAEQIALVEAVKRLRRWSGEWKWRAGMHGQIDAASVQRGAPDTPWMAGRTARYALDAQAIDDVLALLTAVTGKDTTP